MEKFDEGKFFSRVKSLILFAFLFLLIGVTLQATAFYRDFTEFQPLLDNYLGQHTKAERDSASAGSELALMQADIAKFPPTLMTFKLVGIGSLLTGIFFLLFAILQGLKAMPKRLSFLCPKCGGKYEVKIEN